MSFSARPQIRTSIASNPVTGKDLGLSLCRALCLDPDRITDLAVTCDTKGLAKLTVSRLLNDDEAEAISTVLSEYTLEPQA